MNGRSLPSPASTFWRCSRKRRIRPFDGTKFTWFTIRSDSNSTTCRLAQRKPEQPTEETPAAAGTMAGSLHRGSRIVRVRRGPRLASGRMATLGDHCMATLSPMPLSIISERRLIAPSTVANDTPDRMSPCLVVTQTSPATRSKQCQVLSSDRRCDAGARPLTLLAPRCLPQGLSASSPVSTSQCEQVG